MTPLDTDRPPASGCHVLLFLRYPQPGKTKTRLIPALGAAGAAQLQRDMAEYLLKKLNRPEWQLTVCFTGASQAKMANWLGSGINYWPQASGDLGDRLWEAFCSRAVPPRVHPNVSSTMPSIAKAAVQTTVQTTAPPLAASPLGQSVASAYPPEPTTYPASQRSPAPQRVIAIGADCPDLSVKHLHQAFTQLSHTDLVLGPATDGGYYLIGLRQPPQPQAYQSLFQDIDWSTPRVLQQTQAKAQRAGLSWVSLEPLSDIDRPSDLAIWARLNASSCPQMAAQHL